MIEAKDLRIIITTVVLFTAGAVSAQKLSKDKYGKVDTVIIYDNATIVKYKSKEGKPVSDTLLRRNVSIKESDIVIVEDGILKNKLQ